MPTIEFREGQNELTIANDSNVTIYAPTWVEKALDELSPHFKGLSFKIGDSQRTWTIKDKLTLVDLIAIGRNEKVNCTGKIKFKLYDGIKKEAVIALRDLVKQCVIVANDTATHFGGYPQGIPITPLNQVVTICDLSALQFQKFHNCGRLVLISENDNEDMAKGLLDDEIYTTVVGQKRSFSYAQALKDKTKRFVPGEFTSNKNGAKKVMFDTKAYQAFVTQDFMLAVSALNESTNNNELLNFKFLKYGTGFFAENLQGPAKTNLSLYLALGVLKGLHQLCQQSPLKLKQIKRLELPFYQEANNPHLARVLSNIQSLCEQYNIEFACSKADALAPTAPQYQTATTNCADMHAPTGNEMHYGSVEAAIAENLQGKGHQFNPICNSQIAERYLKLECPLPANAKSTQVPIKAKPSKIAPYQWPLINAAFSTLVLLVLQVSWGSFIGIFLGVLVVTKLLEYCRNQFKKQQHVNYKQKSDADLNQLEPTQLLSFELGYEAAKSNKQQLRSLFQWQTYRAPKAYYAGFEAKLQDNRELKEKIHTKLKQKAIH